MPAFAGAYDPWAEVLLQHPFRTRPLRVCDANCCGCAEILLRHNMSTLQVDDLSGTKFYSVLGVKQNATPAEIRKVHSEAPRLPLCSV